MDYVALGRQIRRCRQIKFWTQERLAAAAGISASFLGHIERGSRKASLETLLALANALDCSVDSLLHGQLRDHCAFATEDREAGALFAGLLSVIYAYRAGELSPHHK